MRLPASRVAVLADRVEAALDTGRAVVEIPTVDLARLLLVNEQHRSCWRHAAYVLERLSPKVPA